VSAGAFRRVGIVAKRSSSEALETAHELADWLGRRGLEPVLDEAGARARPDAGGAPFDSGAACDLVIVLGGDGTLLSVARTLEVEVPILGVNLGRLGFLTEVNRTELYASLEDVLAGRYALEARSMINVELIRGGSAVQQFRVLNDAVIGKSALARIIELTLEVDGKLVSLYRADGLIVSTPTGSTAYNLSAGGPIIDPALPIIVITPICPHTLSQRPIVVPSTSAIEVTLETPREEVYLTLDGQEGEGLECGDVVRLTPSQLSARLVRTSGRTFYDSLRGKLHWGE
jgi:NAD+ kinase